jgi:hypothetical protein
MYTSERLFSAMKYDKSSAACVILKRTNYGPDTTALTTNSKLFTNLVSSKKYEICCNTIEIHFF